MLPISLTTKGEGFMLKHELAHQNGTYDYATLYRFLSDTDMGYMVVEGEEGGYSEKRFATEEPARLAFHEACEALTRDPAEALMEAGRITDQTRP